ncbi:daunorubicin ABC transporter ATPase [Pontibacillus halophilus JSM 076056 = DSM 19796]|uniref:Daunorubicin ABC transporter ATPase n=1 Tax=Pontibacillus halophilus JSM 076056 = DSM 19796 TaxID=1385510 RepID=A0A0A5GHZ5_9BACI|nr:daunorubicin ABC transporter ATPase [Pontibacillus halophilus JSM 076056 = DSM 19796]
MVVNQLSKTFTKGSVTAVKDVSFDVKEGEFFAFLGPNGAGKSTTVQILTTLIEASSGSVYVAEQDVTSSPQEVRKHIGVALQETGIDPGLTGREMLMLQCRIFGYKEKEVKERSNELLRVVQLEEAADRVSGNYSGGMRRRLDLALTLVNRPKILFLDEPTTGLDPSNRKSIWRYLEKLNKEEGTTVFLTTQYLEEADYLADRICIIDGGEIVASGTPEELKRSIGNDLLVLRFHSEADGIEALRALQQWGNEGDMVRVGAEIKAYAQDGTKLMVDVVRTLDQSGISIDNMNLTSPTLDDIFLKITNKEASKGKGVNLYGE